MTVADELEAAIAADPDGHEAYVIYGDYLEAQGDPRGALIAIGNALAQNPADKAMLAAHAQHVGTHVAALLGPLATCADIVTDINWYRGFIRACRVGSTYARYLGERPNLAIADVLGWLLDEPGPARFLQHLGLGEVGTGDASHAAVCAAIARRPRPALRSLVLGDVLAADETAELGDLAALWAAAPNLKSVALRWGGMALGPIALPRLESLQLFTAGLDPASLGRIATTAWPALTTLALAIGRPDEGAANDVEILQPLLDATGVPALRTLRIESCFFSDELAARLATSRLLPQLTTLELVMGTMTSDGASIITAHRDRFAHVALDVSHNALGFASEMVLRRAVRSLTFGEQNFVEDGVDTRHDSAGE